MHGGKQGALDRFACPRGGDRQDGGGSGPVQPGAGVESGVATTSHGLQVVSLVSSSSAPQMGCFGVLPGHEPRTLGTPRAAQLCTKTWNQEVEDTSKSPSRPSLCPDENTKWERRSWILWSLMSNGHDIVPECSANVMSLWFDQWQH